VLVFLVDEDIPWPPKLIEGGASGDRLQAFKVRLRSDHAVAALTTPEKLRARRAAATRSSERLR
jgi:hypothetical protein